MAKILDYTEFRDLNDELICRIAIDCDGSSNEGYSIELSDGYTSDSISFGHGEHSKAKCESLYYALYNFCDQCFEGSDYDETTFWNFISEEFDIDWVSIDENGLVSTTWENLNKLDSFITKYLPVNC